MLDAIVAGFEGVDEESVTVSVLLYLSRFTSLLFFNGKVLAFAPHKAASQPRLTPRFRFRYGAANELSTHSQSERRSQDRSPFLLKELIRHQLHKDPIPSWLPDKQST